MRRRCPGVVMSAATTSHDPCEECVAPRIRGDPAGPIQLIQSGVRIRDRQLGRRRHAVSVRSILEQRQRRKRPLRPGGKRAVADAHRGAHGIRQVAR